MPIEKVILTARLHKRTSLVAPLLLLVAPLAAQAQTPPNPQFKYGKADEKAPDVEKKLQAKGGVVSTAGNSRSTTATLGAAGSYKSGANLFSSDLGFTYATASILTANDANMNGTIDDGAEIGRSSNTTSRLMAGKARYDRFLTLNNAAYASAQALSNKPAGKQVVAGGQVGYSRQVFKNDAHRAVAELGYDFSFEKATAEGATGVQVHSGRVFVAEEMKVTDATGATASAELLMNLNKEKAPAPGYDEVDALGDVRVAGKVGLTTTLWGNLSFGFSFGLKYDSAPAPLTPFKGTPFGPDFHPLSKKIDTITEATLIVTFL